MSSPTLNASPTGSIIRCFRDDVLNTYENNLQLFFDPTTGAVIEPGREDGTPRFLFTEVTGYAILDSLLLYAMAQRSRHLEAARRAATWIVSEATDPTGGVLARFFFDQDDAPQLADKSFAGRRIYSFDTAICLQGLVAAWQATGDRSFLDGATRLGRYLVEIASNESGEVVAIYDAKAGRAVESVAEVWSRHFHAFLSKCAEALIDLYEVTENDRFKQRAIAICDASLAFQAENGAFETSPGRTELHPHCYATEGLLHVGRRTKLSRFIDSARRATKWALDQTEDGEIAQVIAFKTGEKLARFRTDGLAQVLALASDLRQMHRLDDEYDSTVDALAAKVLSMRSEPHGYFHYGFYEREFRGKIEADTYSYWTQMFCLRGLEKYYSSRLLQRTYIAVLAGGIGSRCWPLSCEHRPKHVSHAFLGDRSLLQETIRRYVHDDFVSPNQVYVLTRSASIDQMSEQAGLLGVPRANCVIEPQPKGTIPASMLALNAMPNDDEEDRLIVISMADNVITPYRDFQNALKMALFSAAENDCVLSVGRPVEPSDDFDDRFGYMCCDASIYGDRVCQVSRFAEKPDRESYEELRTLPGRVATESGAVIFREEHFRGLIPAEPEGGNLAEHLLSCAAPWSSIGENAVRMAATILSPGGRFEDFGVPGRNLLDFHAGDPRCELGNGNICVGNSKLVTTLYGANNLIIADELPLSVYGLEDFLVIDSAVANTTVIMPIDDVQHLPSLFRLLQGVPGYEAFTTGGPDALTAAPITFVESSPNASVESTNGLVFAYNFPERLTIRRTAQGVQVLNRAYPDLSATDFKVLSQKQTEDSRLVQHVLHVATLAKAFLGGETVLSGRNEKVLNALCVYHAIGGHLNEVNERLETRLAGEFARISRLDRRLLDTRVVDELLRLGKDTDASSAEDRLGPLDHTVASTVEFLRRHGTADPDFRDRVTMLIQAQNNPHLFAAANRKLRGTGLLGERDEFDTVFGIFKIAQSFVNGRWLWKRTRPLVAGSSGAGFLERGRGTVEDLPFMVAFTVDWLTRAGIEPRPFVARLDKLLTDETSDFRRTLARLDEGTGPLVCDRAYTYLMTEDKPESGAVLSVLEEGISDDVAPELVYQYVQALEMPSDLEKIAVYSTRIDESRVTIAREAVVDFYHRHWKVLRGHTTPDVLRTFIQ